MIDINNIKFNQSISICVVFSKGTSKKGYPRKIRELLNERESKFA